MTTLREAAQQALEALEGWENHDRWVWPESALEQAKRNTTEALAALRAALAEPQEPDSPERRCGGPGCDGTCCQPVQEPQGCAHCNHPLYAAVKCKVCGRVTEPVQGPVAWMVYTLDGKSVCVTDNPADFTDEYRVLPLFTAPPQRKPLTDEEIRGHTCECVDDGTFDMRCAIDFARAIERAHGIGGQDSGISSS